MSADLAIALLFDHVKERAVAGAQLAYTVGRCAVFSPDSTDEIGKQFEAVPALMIAYKKGVSDQHIGVTGEKCRVTINRLRIRLDFLNTEIDNEERKISESNYHP